ncbi:MAG: hypothetical protein OXG11_00920 [Chloroflexi bacterium]|nr:hypothetical protein [Chloroflexota bacterium]
MKQSVGENDVVGIGQQFNLPDVGVLPVDVGDTWPRRNGVAERETRGVNGEYIGSPLRRERGVLAFAAPEVKYREVLP